MTGGSPNMKESPCPKERKKLQVGVEIKQKRGYLNDEDTLKERSYKDKVQIPVLPDSELLPPLSREREILLALYEQVCAGWRTLTEVRFKLLGFLPLVSGTVLITILSQDSSDDYRLPWKYQLLVGLFGLAVTSGLFIYEKRNTSLYNDLIGRGRQIENELGVHTGHFRGRPKSKSIVQHDIALNIIYVSCILAWGIILLTGLQKGFFK